MIRLALCAALSAVLLAPAAAAPYLVAGTTDGGEAYSARGDLVASGYGLRVQRDSSQGSLRGVLRRHGAGWQGELRSPPGLRGALVEAEQTLLQARVTPDGAGYRLQWRDANGGAGQETWSGALPRARGLNALGLDVFARALTAAERGAVPAGLLASGENRVGKHVLETGPQIFAAAGDLIASAEREVLIQTFYWKTPCQAGDLIFAGLARLEANRRAAGATTPIDVFVVVNKHLTTRKNVKNLERDVAESGLDPRYVRLHTAGFKQRIYGNMHSKAFVVDGARALLTSANVHAAQDAPDPWYELGFTLEGPACAGLRAEFADLWQRSTQSAMPAAPPPLAAGIEGGVPVAVVTRLAAGNPLSNRIDDPAGQSFVAAFQGATRRIRILSPHLNDEVLRRELVAAARRGVEVQVVLSKGKGKLRVSLPFQGGTNARAFKRLRKALADEPGALKNLDLRWFSVDGVVPHEGDGGGVNHAKYTTVDGELAIVGSSNHDAQAINHSRELNVVIADDATVLAWDAQVFEPAFARAIPAE